MGLLFEETGTPTIHVVGFIYVQVVVPIRCRNLGSRNLSRSLNNNNFKKSGMFFSDPEKNLEGLESKETSREGYQSLLLWV